MRTGETLLIAAVGGIVFTLIGFPAGLISGSLLAVAAVGLIGRPVMVPRSPQRPTIEDGTSGVGITRPRADAASVAD